MRAEGGLEECGKRCGKKCGKELGSFKEFPERFRCVSGIDGGRGFMVLRVGVGVTRQEGELV